MPYELSSGTKTIVWGINLLLLGLISYKMYSIIYEDRTRFMDLLKRRDKFYHYPEEFTIADLHRLSSDMERCRVYSKSKKNILKEFNRNIEKNLFSRLLP